MPTADHDDELLDDELREDEHALNTSDLDADELLEAQLDDPMLRPGVIDGVNTWAGP